MIDFGKILKQQQQDPVKDPVKLYENLDRKANAGPLRPDQSYILSDWYDHHFTDKDIIVKLYTGGGKTLIGLLMLQSRLNAKNGPCLYVCPTKQLVCQVAKDADKFGIPYLILDREKNLPLEFINSKKVLITNIYKVFNGKTIFGLDNRNQSIGTFLIDDSHACIDAIKNSYTITINRENPLYDQLFNLFSTEMKKLGEGTLNQIKENDLTDAMQIVPYWDWIPKSDEVVKKLIDNQSDNEIGFALPLLQDIIKCCSAYFTYKYIKIIPDYPLIERFTSFTTAKQRILMSATTQNDSFFIRGFNFSTSAISNPITSPKTKWAGEKMIIFPSLIDKSLSTNSIRYLFAKSSYFATTILVPGNYHADIYKKLGAKVGLKDDINKIITDLQNNVHSEATVFMNRYDGIDLADDCCRILVIDSLPNFSSLDDKYEEACRNKSSIIRTQIAQKIEQGLGRSVRSEKDYCVIIINGQDLVNFIKNSETNKLFSSQTRKQIEISDKFTKLAIDEAKFTKPLDVLLDLMTQCLKRNKEWKEFYTQTMNQITTNKISNEFIKIYTKERDADIAISKQDFVKAADLLRQVSSIFKDDPLEEGWYLQKVAKYTYFENHKEAYKIQRAAFKKNRYLMVYDKIEYKNIGEIDNNRMQNILQKFSSCKNFDDVQLEINEILENLSFGISAKKFERAVQNIGYWLGFESQRPDEDYQTGPDNLWNTENKYILIECKDEVKTNRPTISKSEIDQLGDHIGWFQQKYSSKNLCINLIIHPTLKYSKQANPNYEFRVITPTKLEKLKNAIESFIKGLSKYDIHSLTSKTLTQEINDYHLNIEDFRDLYSENPIKEN